MAKGKKSNVKNVLLLAVLVVLVVGFFIIKSKQMAINKDASKGKVTDVDILIEKDLELYYPETPREVVKLYSNMIKTLYSGIDDEKIEALALKIRELYDKEFLAHNPEDRYIADLYSEIAIWNKANRKITNVILGDKIETYTKNDMEFATIKVSYTIEEKSKEIERKHYILRKNEKGQWKILGWELDGTE
ncbi:MAG: hypothetical protein GX288_01670 [Clostridiales bacterium]|jgi:hypothetical protein|nr:hypothetical protein [Clostridiales bacterium]